MHGISKGSSPKGTGLKATSDDSPTFGDLMRKWRAARRVSQLDLAHEAEVSARHICFLETGRARPSREMVDRLAGALEVPLRGRNALLLAAGFAPQYPERTLQDPALSPAQRGVRFLLDSHHPFPAFAIDRLWNVLLSNRAHQLLLDWTLGPGHRETNLLRLVLAPDLLRPKLLNWPLVAAALMRRLDRQLALPSADHRLEALYAELIDYPGVRCAKEKPPAFEPHSVIVPMQVEAHGRRLSWFSTLASFGAAVDITLEEIVIEALHPMDEATAQNARQLVATLEGEANGGRPGAETRR